MDMELGPGWQIFRMGGSLQKDETTTQEERRVSAENEKSEREKRLQFS